MNMKLENATQAQTKSLSLNDLADDAYIRIGQIVPNLVPISRATLWRYVRAKKFPAPRKLGANVTAWRVIEVKQWLLKQAG
jgi:prophage regulatory protein